MSLQDHYPQSCPFCKIAATYPVDKASPVPDNPDPEKIDPQCHLILSTEHVLAFLDILPIASGHVLLTTRKHWRTLGDMYTPPKGGTWRSHQEAQNERNAARAIGEYLPIVSRALCKVTGIEDWNVVQNNGERAAQVVPHVHFHLIPRYQEGRTDVGSKKGRVDVGMLKSWRMFGRGTREELDDEEGVEVAGRLREALRLELGERGGKTKL